MAKQLNITDEQREEASRNIENFRMFTEDVLADPSILDRIPNDAEVIPIPKAEREPGQRYDVETRRMVATVTPVQPEELNRRTSA